VSISAFATSLSAGTGFGVGSITFTPRSTASRFLIQAHVPVATSVPDSNIYTALFSSNSATAIQQTKTYNAAISQSLIHPLVGVLSPNTVSPVVVSIRAAKSGLNTGLVNEGNTPTLITVTEFNS
jgi:hypothetical protein